MHTDRHSRFFRPSMLAALAVVLLSGAAGGCSSERSVQARMQIPVEALGVKIDGGAGFEIDKDVILPSLSVLAIEVWGSADGGSVSGTAPLARASLPGAAIFPLEEQEANCDGVSCTVDINLAVPAGGTVILRAYLYVYQSPNWSEGLRAGLYFGESLPVDLANAGAEVQVDISVQDWGSLGGGGIPGGYYNDVSGNAEFNLPTGCNGAFPSGTSGPASDEVGYVVYDADLGVPVNMAFSDSAGAVQINTGIPMGRNLEVEAFFHGGNSWWFDPSASSPDAGALIGAHSDRVPAGITSLSGTSGQFLDGNPLQLTNCPAYGEVNAAVNEVAGNTLTPLSFASLFDAADDYVAFWSDTAAGFPFTLSGSMAGDFYIDLFAGVFSSGSSGPLSLATQGNHYYGPIAQFSSPTSSVMPAADFGRFGSYPTMQMVSVLGPNGAQVPLMTRINATTDTIPDPNDPCESMAPGGLDGTPIPCFIGGITRSWSYVCDPADPVCNDWLEAIEITNNVIRPAQTNTFNINVRRPQAPSACHVDLSNSAILVKHPMAFWSFTAGEVNLGYASTELGNNIVGCGVYSSTVSSYPVPFDDPTNDKFYECLDSSLLFVSGSPTSTQMELSVAATESSSFGPTWASNPVTLTCPVTGMIPASAP